MKPSLKIEKAVYLNNYVIELYFNDKTVQTLDFYDFLSTSINLEIKKYLDLRKFKKFKIVNGDLMWGDFDMLFPIADLYQNQINKKSFLSRTG